jgi:DNA-directed RNA polymerase subunit RPC12/RpoP
MGMRLRMTAVTSPRMVMRCSTCKQQIGGRIRDATANANANLFGAAKYVDCPTCHQVVPEQIRTRAYKAVWTRKIRTQG